MSGKQTVLAVLIIGLGILAASAAAQDEQNELTGLVGRTFISDQAIIGPNAPSINPTIHSGDGLSFEISYARILRSTPIYSVSGEVPAMFNLDEDLNAGGPVVPVDYKQIFVTPGVRVNLFPATAVSPWASVGGGFGRFSENKNLLYFGTNPSGSSTTGVFEWGVGLDVRPFQRHRFSHMSIRGELRDFWSGTPSLPLADTGKTRQHNYFVGVGVIWHF